jgi:hypothetical protein
MHRLSFGVQHLASGAAAVTAEVDGIGLDELVTHFEQSPGFDLGGGYGPLIPEHFKFGELGAYFLGEGEIQWPRPEWVWMLGCQCGEVGCWPLEVHVVRAEDVVTWDGFAQPHRHERSYEGFGPFVFAADQYAVAVDELITVLQ